MSVPFYGDFDTTETVYIPFNTFDSNDPSGSVTITNLAATDLHAHKDGSITQRTSTSGFTITINFDGITGNHMAAIDLSDNTDAGFWANGSQISIRMEGTTVDAGTVNAWIGSFSIGRTLRPTTAGRTLDVTAGGTAGIDWANVESPTTAVDLSATDIQLADTVTTLTNKTGFSLAATGLDAIASTATGMVEIAKAVWDRVLSGATHNIATSAGRRLRNLQDFGVYEGGYIWLDTVNGTAGTTDFENGTVNNPVDTIADAFTLRSSVNLPGIHVMPASTFTLAASAANIEFVGQSYTMALGGQAIEGAYIFHCVDLTGTATGSNGSPWIVQESQVGTASLGAYGFMEKTALSGTLTLTSTSGVTADIVSLIDCTSSVAGGGSPSITMAGVTKTTSLNIRRWSGGLSLTLTADCTVSVDAVSGGTITINGTGGTVHIRGMVAVTDSSGGSVTIVQTQALNRDSINGEVVDALATDTYAEPGQGAPAATTTLAAKINYLYKSWRNLKDNDGTTTQLYNDAGSVVDQKQTTSEAAGTVTKAEWVSGP